MKTWILAAAMIVGVTMTAQQRGDRPEPMKPEQRAELHAKKMTLALNLNDKQQKDIKNLLTDRSKKAQQFMAERKTQREAGKKNDG